MIVADRLVLTLSSIAKMRSRHRMEEAELWAELGEALGQFEIVATRGSVSPPDGVPSPPLNDLLSVAQTSNFLGVAASTLNKWRVVGSGPEFVRLGRRIMYRRQALEAFISDKSYPHTSAYSFQSRANAKK